MNFPRPSTLKITFPTGQTLALALLILVLLVAALEGLVRLPFFESHVPMAIGSSHPDVDVKFSELDYLLERDGKIDCIMIGSSMVRRGFDPLAFGQAYRQQTGQDLLCYNFGVADGRGSGLAALSEILVKRYHPRLLILGFSLREFSGTLYVAVEQQRILSAPWVQYQLGSFNVTGWTVEHFKAFRHYMAVREWPSPDFESPFGDLDDPLRLGYVPMTTLFAGLPGEGKPRRFRFTDSEWNGLEQWLTLRSQTQLLVVEVPPSERLMSQVEGGEAVYRTFITQISDFVSAHDVPVWTVESSLIPAGGWGDAVHLNQLGADVYSRWVGDQIGAGVDQGTLVLR